MTNRIRYFEENCISVFEKIEDEFMKNLTHFADYVYAITGELYILKEKCKISLTFQRYPI